MISRLADACFWFGRYVERAECTARLLEATRHLVFDADIAPERCWEPLVIVAGEEPNFVARHGAAGIGQGELVQEHMTWNDKNAVSMRTSLRAAREIARTMREVLSLEVWEEVNQLFLWLDGGDGERLFAEQREAFYRHVRRSTQLSLGLVRSTMLHDDPMRFLWLGVMLERVGQTARILDMHHHTVSGVPVQEAVELGLWVSLLRACSGFEAYMKRNRGRVTRDGIVAFLIFEAQFPRSLRYCLRSALQTMRQIWPPNDLQDVLQGSAPLGGARSCAAIGALCAWLDDHEPEPRAVTIHELLTGVVDRTAEACTTLGEETLGPASMDAPSAPMEQ